jgi:hypothetical protein
MDPIDVGSVVRPLGRWSQGSRRALCCVAVAGAAALAACSSSPAESRPAAAPSVVADSASPSPLPSPPAGAVPSPASADQQQAFMDCMRAHGAPLPGPGSGTIVNGGSGSSAPDQAKMQAALQACRALLPGASSGAGPGG